MTDTHLKVLLKDDQHPEDTAMLQALYSRSPASVTTHLDRVKEVGSGKFMDQYYLGYGHQSIGDCGTTTVFIENVSMLVAKAIQDSGLYNGQEASTRYLDFAVQRVVDPFNHTYTTRIQERWIDLYNTYLPKMIAALKIAYPFSEADGVPQGQYNKTISAKAFDIVRSLLPIGTTTNLSWHTTLRHARDHLRFLYGHPLHEVNETVVAIHQLLVESYPNSFDSEILSESKIRDVEFARSQRDEDYYLDYRTVNNRLSTDDWRTVVDGGVVATTLSIDIESINFDHADALRRAARTPLPRYLTQYGNYNFYFMLDFGSFRDIQRHRNGFCPIPLVTSHYGFYRWYDEEFKKYLSPTDYRVLRNHINELIAAADDAGRHVPILDRHEQQYLYPMGISCVCQLAYSLPQSVYVAELRSGTTVHDSLRQVIHKVGNILEDNHPDLNLFMNREKDPFSLKRGSQDITEKAK